MAGEKKRKGKSRKGTQGDRDVTVELTPTVEFLHKELSELLCQEVFQDLRDRERQRKWCLFALARFWLAVVTERAIPGRSGRRGPGQAV